MKWRALQCITAGLLFRLLAKTMNHIQFRQPQKSKNRSEGGAGAVVFDGTETHSNSCTGRSGTRNVACERTCQ